MCMPEREISPCSKFCVRYNSFLITGLRKMGAKFYSLFAAFFLFVCFL